MTLTRGEGGQNEIGSELFDALGVLRSRELEAAGRYTGVQQYFSPARDFGYSFAMEETFAEWQRPSVLREMVRRIRAFRPDVLLTMLTDPGGGGQHHQASADIAIEAFEVAASERWPELGTPHRTQRLFRQVWSAAELPDICEVPLNEYDPVLGCTYLELGRESRAQHKCQGMARLGAPRGLHSRWQWLRGGEAAPASDLLAGVRTWQLLGLPASFRAAVEERATAVRSKFSIENPGAVLADLAQLWQLYESVTLRPDSTVDRAARLATLRGRCARALQLAIGLQIQGKSAARWLSPGSDWEVTVDLRAGEPCAVRGQVLAEERPGVRVLLGKELRRELQQDEEWSGSLVVQTPATPTLPVPVPQTALEVVDAAMSAQYAANRWQSFWLHVVLQWGDVEVPLALIPIECHEVSAELPTIFRSDPQVVPDPALQVRRAVLPVRAETARDGVMVEAQVSSLRGGDVEVEGVVSAGWELTPPRQVVKTAPGGVVQSLRFRLSATTGEVAPGELSFRARAGGEVPGPWSAAGYRVVEYPHIRPGALLTRPSIDLRPMSCVVPPRRVAFVEGAGGDEMPWALSVLGIQPSFLSRRDLEEGDLSAFDVIITGVRAYKVRAGLQGAHPRLMQWLREGGTLVVQYNKFEFNQGKDESPFAPHSGALVSRRRVTVESAPLDFLVPQHPFLTTPNRLTAADWTGWVQERGLYFLDAPSPPYQNLVAVADPWPNNPGRHLGSLVVADIGKGRWVYVGLALFRQLAAGVPGGYRLLANLLAAVPR